MSGKFFVFEGIDGCGKTTQAEFLVTALEKRGLKTVHLREPGGTPIGEFIRGLLLDHREVEMAPWTEVFLFMASRAQLVADRLRPALQRGDTVVLDRYYYSTAAYQGAAGGIGVLEILDLSERVAKFDRPDRIFLLDLDPRIALQRMGPARDRLEARGLRYQEQVREGFVRIARSDKDRFRIIDASQPAAAIHKAVLAEVDRVL